MNIASHLIVFALSTVSLSAFAAAQFGLPEISEASKDCVDCHRKEDPGLYHQWGSSRHFTANVGCYECHSVERGEPGASLHHDHYISTIVSPRMCARCHSREVEEFSSSLHAKAGQIAGSDAHLLAELVDGATTLRTAAHPEGISAVLVTGCSRCHGSNVRVLPSGRLDAATWPNYGIGRSNPDGSLGACAACHSPHTFSVFEARQPETCAKCHVGHNGGSNIFGTSAHGALFRAHHDDMNLDRPKWILGEDYAAAPTCATCHMSATINQPVTHNVGLRLSWNHRPVVSVRSDTVDANLGLASADVSWQDRRLKMQEVCLNCHSRDWVNNFYTAYDGTVALYHEKFAEPGRELYALAAPLMQTTRFSNKLDFVWYEMWSEHGRRARQAASMASPHEVQSSMHAVSRFFYTEFVPELQALVERGLASNDPEQITIAEALQTRLEEVLGSEYHRAQQGRMSAGEAARREQQREAYRSRYLPPK